MEHATEVLGVRDTKEVEPNMDIEAIIRRMQRANRGARRRAARGGQRKFAQECALAAVERRIEKGAQAVGAGVYRALL